jgi:ferredoxin-NADP reductase
MAASQLIKLTRREAVAAGTEAFYFERPAAFAFTAGQFLEMSLLDPDLEAAQRVHSFTIASAPCETELMITTRLRDSAFKRSLRRLAVGSEVAIEGPYGRFVLDRATDRPIAFVAGGIGITPIRSIVVQAAFEGALPDAVLFYSNRQAEEAAFVSELARHDGGLRLVQTLTGESALDWAGERGRIDLAMIERYLPAAAASFYVSGPPAMVTGLRDLLTDAGIDRGQIRVERFDGY